MQAQFMIDQSLAKNLIDFFANQWLESYSSYNHYTAEQASKSIKMHIDCMLGQGFETSWSLGGISNNCWGNSSTVSAEIEPDLPCLDEFFMEFYPNIGFLQYKLVTKAIERTNHSHSDYYGGSTSNGKKSLHFSNFSQALIKAKVIVDPEIILVSDMDNYIKEKFSADNMSQVFPTKTSKKTKK